ncbi:MAG: hypothetical protein A2X48_12815 [Lentisphaerae bacterium GWF2_49_21]|nr:MAG: hypothetical protein A2X48_12815 [Lentisphaerae bacterium GWF2_49_21]
MTSNNPDWKIDGDPERQATNAWKGYVYQVWHTLHAWLDLKEGQVLYVEGAEDFDIVDSGTGIPVQVKHTSANITLRSQGVIDAISHFWQLRKKHTDKIIEFHFLTCSHIGVEEKEPFGKDKGGMALWQECSGEPEAVEILTSFMSSDPTLSRKLPSDLIEFLKTEKPSVIFETLIFRMKWLTEAPPMEAVIDAVNRKIINYGTKFGVFPDDCTKVSGRLLQEVLKLASCSSYENRQLDYNKFELIFQETTSTRVPNHFIKPIEQLQDIGLGTIAGTFKDFAVTFRDETPIVSMGSPPPLPPNLALRHALVEKFKVGLRQGRKLFINSSTGMGKSTLAKLTALSFGGDWAWFSFSSYHDKRYIWALNQAARLIDSLPLSTHVILDDLPFDPGNVPEWEQNLAALVYTLQVRQVMLIATSRKPVPKRLCNSLGLLPCSESTVPAFDEDEIRGLCIQMGCEKGRPAQIQAKVVFLHTLGHPQLVHARLLTLARQGWPKISYDSILATPEDVKEQQAQARQLLCALESDEKDLLYRASVALTPFRREHIVRLGEKAKLKHPGDIFDRIVGPWIERTADDRFELSPLLRNSASEVWSVPTIEKIHAEIADVIMNSKALSITDGSHAFLHALLGRNKSVLGMMAISLMKQSSKETQQAFGQSMFWFLSYKVESDSGSLFDNDANLSFLLRMLQFRLCAIAEPDKAPQILSALERELPELDNTPATLLPIMLFCINGLLYVQVPLKMSYVIYLFKKLELIQQRIIESQNQELLDSIPVTEFGSEGKRANILSTLFGVNGMRCKTKEDLSELLEELSKLDDKLRQNLLEAFNNSYGFASFCVDNVFLSEFRSKTPDWPRCLAILCKTMDYAVEWNSPSLGAAAVRTSATILDEHLNRLNDALSIIDDGVKRFPSSSRLMEEHRGTVLLHAKQYPEAVDVFTRVLQGRDDDCLDVYNVPTFSFRNAGIAAANAEQWDGAAVFFLRGYRCSMKTDNVVLAAAFQTEAAYAFWKAGKTDDMLKALRISIDMIDTMGRGKDNLGQFWVYRISAHNLSWLNSMIEKGKPPDELETPIVGVCSSPERNKMILDLPDIPFDFTLYFLVNLEKTLHAEPISMKLYGSRLEHTRLPVVAMFIGELKIETAIRSGNTIILPQMLDGQIRSVLAAMKIKDEGKKPWEVSEWSASDADIISGLLRWDFIECPFLVAIYLLILDGDANLLNKRIQEWKNSSTSLIWGDILAEYLSKANSLGNLSSFDLISVLVDSKSGPHERNLAALFLSHRRNEIENRDMLQAHVFLLDKFSYSRMWGQYAEATLSGMLSDSWKRVCQSPFALQMPQITVPALQDACSIKPEGFAKAGKILLAASNAIGVRMPQVLVDRYRMLTDS